LKAAEMRFLRPVAGYRLIDNRRNEDIREELLIIDVNSRIKDYQIKWLQHLERMEQKTIPKLLLNYKPRVEETRDVHVEDGENSFKMFIGFNFKQLL
jgi:hypothetical protein